MRVRALYKVRELCDVWVTQENPCCEVVTAVQTFRQTVQKKGEIRHVNKCDVLKQM